MGMMMVMSDGGGSVGLMAVVRSGICTGCGQGRGQQDHTDGRQQSTAVEDHGMAPERQVRVEWAGEKTWIHY
jgi:hypothetical protein